MAFQSFFDKQQNLPLGVVTCYLDVPESRKNDTDSLYIAGFTLVCFDWGDTLHINTLKAPNAQTRIQPITKD